MKINNVLDAAACVFAFVMFTQVVLAADPERTVTPQQIVSEALAHSYQLKITGIETQVLSLREKQAVSRSLPSLKVAASATSYSGLEDSVFGPGVSFPAIDNRYGFYAELSQTIFTGGKIRNSIRTAAFDTASAESSMLAADADLRLQALTAYWNWSKAQLALAAIGAAARKIESHSQDVRNQLKNGLATESDALSAEVLLDQTNLKLQDAQRNLNLARAAVAFVVGHDLAADAVPEKPDLAALALIPVGNERSIIEAAITNRPERLSAEMATRSAEAQIGVSRSTYYPQVSLVARYEQARPNAMFFPPVDEWDNDTFVGAMVSWSLFDGGLTHAKATESAARAKQARLRTEQLTDSIALEVKEARIRLDSAIARLAVAERAEKSAQRNLEVSRNQLQNGTARHSDVLDAESRYADATYEMAVSGADAALAKAVMDHAMGMLGR
jgi:outer membrane protein